MGGNILPTKAQKRPQKYHCLPFAEILLAEHTVLEEIILDKVSLGGGAQFLLPCDTYNINNIITSTQVHEVL